MMSEQLPQWTDVTDAMRDGDTIDVWVGRTHTKLHYTELTFVGDEHPELFERGETYRLVTNAVPSPPVGKHTFENIESRERLTAYYEDVRYYLLNGCFHVDNWR